MSRIVAMTLAFLAILPLPDAVALELWPYWSQDFKQWLRVTCDQEEDVPFCTSLCQQPRECVLAQQYCRNCAGTALLYVKDVLDTLGDVYVGTEEQVSRAQVLERLRSGAYITLTSDTVFNYIDTFDSEALQIRFQRLCWDPSKRPVLFLDAHPRTRVVGRVLFVACQDAEGRFVAFKVARSHDAELNSSAAPALR